jgi:hypothetical protein
MTRRDLEVLSDALGQALAQARRVGGGDGIRADAVWLTVKQIGLAFAQAGLSPARRVKFEQAVEKAAANALPGKGE